MAGFSNGSRKERDGSGLLRFLPLGLIILGACFFFATGLHRSLSLEALVRHHTAIRDLVGAYPFASVGLYVLIYIAIVTLSIPASVYLNITGGFLFGWALGGALAAIGSTLGGASIFLIARTSVGEPIMGRAGPRIQKLAAGFRADAFSYLLFLRLLPVMPFWITNLAAALFGMRLKTFLIATQLGVIPICYAFAFAGSGLDEVIATQEKLLDDCYAAGKNVCSVDLRPESLLTSELVIALALLGILALGSILVTKWQARRGEEQG